jgi:twitching motility two-component system response regulator PilG
MNTKVLQDQVTPTSKKIGTIPYKVLQNILAKKIAGRLTIQDPHDHSIQWRLYLGGGKIHFATSVGGKRERLAYLFECYLPNRKFYISPEIESDYEYICELWHSGQLDLHQTRQILAQITQEALILSLALPHATIRFEKFVKLDPILLSMSLKSLVVPARDDLHQWTQLRADISSPFRRPVIEDPPQDLLKICAQTPFDRRAYQFLEKLQVYFQDRCSLYEIATYTNQRTLNLARFLQPIIRTGGIRILPYRKVEKQELPLVACIDDSQAIQKIVKMTLKSRGFKVIGITEPSKAMISFIHEKPDLILMDIKMPEIDGYQLASMLHKSASLKDIPIMMLTGRDGILDRVKARMVGAVGYISKPFNPQQLAQSVQDNIQKLKAA